VRLRVATRGSALARWQADHVVALLQKVEPSVQAEVVVVETSGDRRSDVPIWELGGKGVFVKEVQAAVLDGRADVAVHSAKDLPSTTPDGLVIAAVPERADVRDALVGARLDELPEGAVVATGSLRRRAQLAARRPDLRFEGLRGNMDTRIARVGRDGVAAVVVAAAALDRLGLADRIAERLDLDVVLPQVGQAALAVECRADDVDTRALLERIEHGPSRRAVDAERGFLRELGGDCSIPAAAHATQAGDGLRVRALVASPDGRVVERHEVSGPATAGAALGRSAARHLLDEQGGARLLGRP
jgi:hydroxymethylbilane synthase